MRNLHILRRAVLTLSMVLAVYVAFGSSPVMAGLAITPTTVIMQGRDRYADLSIVNTDKIPHSYELGWRFYRMEQNTGAYVAIDTPTTEFDLSKHLVFTPKRITLAPSSAQKIRFALRLNNDEPPLGDYRAHFMVQELPQSNSAEQSQQDASGKSRVAMAVNIDFGFTLPIVYRVGESMDAAEMETVKVARDAKTQQITVTVPIKKTQSNFGMYGKISVDLIQGGKLIHLGGLGNANLFPEVTRRVFDVLLGVPALQSGKLRVTFTDRDDPKIIYAQKDIPIK